MKQVVLITGCSRGLGKLLAERLAKKGFIVYAGMRKLEDIKRLKTVWKDSSSIIHPIKIDITLDEDCKKAVKKIIANEKHIDVLINNAAYGLSGPTDSFTSQQYLDILNTNAVGAFRLIREVAPQMRSQKKGRIINITSLNGILALPNFGLYCSSKFALEALALALRYELKNSGVWVTNIEPGAIAQNISSVEKTSSVKKLSHVPAREKFWILKKLMPMVTQEEIIKTIERVIENSNPPARIILGRDAQITTFLQRFLPQRIWDFLLSFISRRSKK